MRAAQLHAQPGVHYSVMATKNDQVATHAGACSFIAEPGVLNVFYEDIFPAGPTVNRSSLRPSPTPRVGLSDN